MLQMKVQALPRKNDKTWAIDTTCAKSDSICSERHFSRSCFMQTPIQLVLQGELILTAAMQSADQTSKQLDL